MYTCIKVEIYLDRLIENGKQRWRRESLMIKGKENCEVNGLRKREASRDEEDGIEPENRSTKAT